MASLGGKTTSGELAWDKYVGKNKNWKELKLETENDTDLFARKGADVASVKKLPKGTSFVLKSATFTTIKNKKYASVTVANKAGFININDIRKPTSFKPTGYETEVVNMINNFIKQRGNAPIDIKLKGDSKVYKGITGAIQVDTNIKRAAGVSSDPKADIILYVDKNKLDSTRNIYISHKKEGGPEAFQQYGGLTMAAGEEIYNHPETKAFMKQVIGYIKGDQLQQPLYKKIKSIPLKNMSIYGPDYNKSNSLQHVNCIGQGLPVLKPTRKENEFELDFSSHMSISGDLSHFTEGYVPVFGATYRAGRGFEFEGKRYSGARVGIYPVKLIAGRGGVVELK
jgi:hypothetical protein